MRGMRCVNDLEQEIERLAALLPAYLCERTGLSMAQVITLLDAQEVFWDGQPHVIGRMVIFGFEIEGEDQT